MTSASQRVFFFGALGALLGVLAAIAERPSPSGVVDLVILLLIISLGALAGVYGALLLMVLWELGLRDVPGTRKLLTAFSSVVIGYLAVMAWFLGSTPKAAIQDVLHIRSVSGAVGFLLFALGGGAAACLTGRALHILIKRFPAWLRQGQVEWTVRVFWLITSLGVIYVLFFSSGGDEFFSWLAVDYDDERFPGTPGHARAAANLRSGTWKLGSLVLVVLLVAWAFGMEERARLSERLRREASEQDERATRVVAVLKERVSRGLLPHPSGAGSCEVVGHPPAPSTLCVGDDGPILPGQPAHGLRCGTATYWFHEDCLDIWYTLD